MAVVKEEWPRLPAARYFRPRSNIRGNAVESNETRPLCTDFTTCLVRIIYVRSQMWPGIRLFSYVEWKRWWKMVNKSSFTVGTIFSRTNHLWLGFINYPRIFSFSRKFKLKLDFRKMEKFEFPWVRNIDCYSWRGDIHIVNHEGI